MSFQINTTPPVEAKKWPPGLGVVITVGVVVLAVGIALNLWLGANVVNQKVWFAATAVVAVLTICLAAVGVYRNRDEFEYEEYIKNLREIDKITHDSKAK
jgi:hypothetical protein